MKKKLAIAGGIIFFLVIGFILGSWHAGGNQEKVLIVPTIYENADLAATRIDLLSTLRLGETNEVINAMERMIDTETFVLTRKSNDPRQLPMQVVASLKQIKAYREIYPSQGQQAVEIAQALEKIPKITNIEKECRYGLYLLIKSKKEENGLVENTD